MYSKTVNEAIVTLRKRLAHKYELYKGDFSDSMNFFTLEYHIVALLEYQRFGRMFMSEESAWQGTFPESLFDWRKEWGMLNTLGSFDIYENAKDAMDYVQGL